MRIFLPLVLFVALPSWVQAEEKADAQEADPKKPAVEQVSETKFRLGTIEFDSDTREIRFPGVVNMTQGILEYVLVHVNGKDHESLFTTEISPTELNIVLKLLRFKTGDGDLFHGFYPPGELPDFEPLGDGIDMFATWPGSIENPVYELIRDEKGDGAMSPLPWIYNGSEVVNGRFEAEYEGSFFAIYRDPLALFNTQHPRAIDDENWFPIKANIPAMETPITIILKPSADKAVQD
ncbi:MAG: YdjY domain-containing protein [Verrucomicrobiota bacterium]